MKKKCEKCILRELLKVQQRTNLEDRNQLLYYTEQNFDVCPKPGYTTQCILNNSIDK